MLIFLRSTGPVFFGLAVTIPLDFPVCYITWAALVSSLMSFSEGA